MQTSAAGASAAFALAQAGLAMTPARSAAGASSRTPTARAGNHIKKAIKYGMVKVRTEGADNNGDSTSIADKFRIVKALGFDGIEMDSPTGLDRDEVKRASEETGLPIHGVVDSVHWSKPFSHPNKQVREKGLEALIMAIDDSKYWGGSTVLVVPAVVSEHVAYDEAYQRSQEMIRQAVPHAEEQGIRIAFENVWNNFLLSPLEAARYVDEFQSDHVGWYFDVGNVVRFAWPEQWIRILGSRIFKLDIKEYSRKKQIEEGLWKGFHVKIGEGDCNWPEVRKALDDIGFEGWATAEVRGGDEGRLREIAERMDKALGISGKD